MSIWILATGLKGGVGTTAADAGKAGLCPVAGLIAVLSAVFTPPSVIGPQHELHLHLELEPNHVGSMAD